MPDSTGPNAMRLAVILRSLGPYSRDFYDAMPDFEGRLQMRLLIGRSGSEWINPWDDGLLQPRRADHVFLNAGSIGRARPTPLPNRDLFAALAKFQPDLVLVHEYSPLAVCAMTWALIRRVPVIVATEIGPDYGHPYPRLGLVQKLVHHFANWGAAGILGLTPSAVRKARVLKKVHLFAPHAIDTEVFRPAARHQPGSGPVVIITTGNFIFRKGHDLLLRALGRPSLAGLPSWRLRCYGAGRPDDLQAMTLSLGLGNRAEFFPFLPQDELVRAYQNADLFVLPTRADTYGVVVHEAAACGLPLVVSKNCGASEVLVAQGENGFVVDPEDSEVFARHISKLVNDVGFRRACAGKSRGIAEKWDVRIMARRTGEWLLDFGRA
jgi:glycosyltransferase involved in cell wall biosynthesis